MVGYGLLFMVNADQSVRHWIAAFWGMIGVMGIVLFAIVRLIPYVIDALAIGLDAWQWLMLLISIVLMAWSEGYKGFQLRFSPRVAARTLYLYRNPTSWGTRLLAPLFCIGYFNASRRARIGVWVGTTAIVMLVLLVHQLDQPWRGILDAGVVAGLSWGLISLIVMTVTTFRAGEYLASPELSDRYNGRTTGD